MRINTFKSKQSLEADNFVKGIRILNLDNETIAERMEIESLLKLIDHPKDSIVLDLGCGTGRIGMRIAKNVREVIGLDLSKSSIQIANRTAKKYKIKNFRGIVGDLDNFKKDNYFDYVVMVSFFHHVDNIQIVLEKIKKVSKKNGACIIMEPNPLNPLFIPFFILIKTFKNHFSLYYLRSNIFTLRKILKDNKFKNIKIFKYGFLPTMLYDYSPIFKKLNDNLNKIPIINTFSAFHIIRCSIN